VYNSDWNNISSNTLCFNDRGILLENSHNNKITSNPLISNNSRGIHLISSCDNNIFDNNVSNGSYGIQIFSNSNGNDIIGNNASNNIVGIQIGASYSNIVIRNIASLNTNYGIYLWSSNDNKIYHNNFINNTIQAYDDQIDNYWDNGYPSGGNYWSDFDEPGEDAYDDFKGPRQNITGSDGIVDNGTIGGGGMNPYVIDSDSMDNYPLIKPFTTRIFENYTLLEKGWNLISVPFIQDNKNLIKALEMIDGYFDCVEYYNTTDTNDHWKINNTGKSFGNDLTEINEKMGFWIHIIQPGVITFLYNGTQPTENQTIQLYPGWNMVGYPSLTGYNRTDGLNNLTFNTHVDSIWSYNATTQKWKEHGELDYFETGRGYWIHVMKKCEWEVPL
jgi:parallel beta-helix repeat protein